MTGINEPDVATLRARGEIRRLATPRREPQGHFSPTRWPSTYACDHIRSRVPEVDSRADASRFIRDLAGKAGLPVEFVREMMAAAYCREFNIPLPQEQIR